MAAGEERGVTKTPWMKWYPGDWRGDARLRACDPLSRYVWMEMLGLMHEAEPYGHLISGNRAMALDVLSRVIGVDSGVVKRAVKQLEHHGVFSRTDQGVIFSRRMVRDKKRSEIAREHGGMGGNPSLINQGFSPPPVNPPDNKKEKPHIPETSSKNIKYENLEARPPVQAQAREAFPPDGSIAFTVWADRARKRGRNIDVDLLASAFRLFCRERNIALDGPWVERTFDTFVGKHKIAGAA